MTSVGIEPTTFGLDLTLLCRLSYEVELEHSVKQSIVWHFGTGSELSLQIKINTTYQATVKVNT